MWRVVLADRVTLGFVRLAALGLAVYVLASIAALTASGRWIKAFTTAGLEADDLAGSTSDLTYLLSRLQETERELDEANRLVWRLLHG
jgi:hypothetical protein